MEQKDIRYTGITQAVSDLDCSDGDLSISHNVINHNGAMRPIILPEPEFVLHEGEKLLYIHSTSKYKNYILLSNNKLCFFSSQLPDMRQDFYNLKIKELYKVNSIGNTLVILTNQGIVYAIYISGSYEVLGANPPFPSISFRLKGVFSNAKTFTVDFQKKTKYYVEINDPIYIFNYRRLVLDNPITSSTMYANINTQAETIRSNGGFQYDFMIRYAYRLYDGKLHMCSVPIYINAGSGTPYFMRVKNFHSSLSDDGTDNIGEYNMIFDMGVEMYCQYSRLFIQINNADELINEREKWKDLIKEIVFFVTPPLFYMDQSFQPSTASKIGDIWGDIIGGTFKGQATLSLGGNAEGEDIYSEMKFPSGAYFKEGRNIIPLMIKPNASGETYVFRHIASIDWKSTMIKSGEQILNIESGALTILQNRERMEGEYNAGEVLVPQDSFVYNARLNLVNVFSIPFEYPLEACVNYTNGRSEVTESYSFYNYFFETYTFKIYILIESSNANVMIVETSSLPLYSLGKFFFYPAPKAFRIIVERTDKNGTKSYSSSKMEEHESLNGAFTDSLSNDFVDDFDISILENTERGFYYPNKIYTSEVNNPFVFPIEGINTIGVGEIVGVSSVTKALSQGQFGQFPLLVFATDGIWAMEVSDAGLYSAKQPISRDVCLNAKSITQIDGAVIFVSDKGVMVVDGSTVNTLSAELDGSSFRIQDIIKLSDILVKEELREELEDIVPLKEFMSGCQIAYDYPNGRLMFINPQKRYAYMYSLYSKTWTTVTSNFASVITDYPKSYIQGKNGKLINISTKPNWDDERNVKYIMLSRPLKLDGDMYKTLNTVINRGMFIQKDMAIVVFASTDGISYFPIGSAKGSRLSRLQGSAFRYFRVLTVGNMSSKESLSATSLYYTPKWRNKPR